MVAGGLMVRRAGTTTTGHDAMNGKEALN